MGIYIIYPPISTTMTAFKTKTEHSGARRTRNGRGDNKKSSLNFAMQHIMGKFRFAFFFMQHIYDFQHKIFTSGGLK